MDWSRFGLDRQPFRPAVDPDSYLPAASHEAALSAIVAAFARRDPAVLLDGAPGVGKTLIARKWLEHLLPDVPRVVLPSVRAEKPAELHQAILFDMSKPYQGLSEQELRLAVTGHLLDAASESGYPTVIVVDEAQHLSELAFEEMRLMGNLETRRGAAVFLLLVAHPALRETLRQPGYDLFAQRLAPSLAIEPLTISESTDYIRHQLRAAGGEPDSLFDSEALPVIAAACGGIPRVVNRVATVALELAASAEADCVDVEAALEALERLGVKTAQASEHGEATEPIVLRHPGRITETTRSPRTKTVKTTDGNEAAGTRGPKDKASRKRTA